MMPAVAESVRRRLASWMVDHIRVAVNYPEVLVIVGWSVLFPIDNCVDSMVDRVAERVM